MDLTDIFNKFVGAEIKNPNRLTCDCDPVMDELVAEARKNGLTVQAVMPDETVTTEYCGTRLRVYVEKAPNSKLKISSLSIG